MSPTRFLLPGLAALIVGGGVAIWRSLTSASRGSSTTGPPSARRLRIVNDILPSVVPSRYGDARFAKLAPGYRPDDPKLPPGFTTCGYLDLFVGHALGAKDGITRGGTEQIRTAGKAANAWVEPGGGRLPSPGDLYGIDKIDSAGNRYIVHVGVIVDASGPVWRTADAGQGPRNAQEAQYVDRPYDAANATLGGPAGPRPLAGWINIDKYPIAGEAVS